jgi:CarD family transcriptional regulator
MYKKGEEVVHPLYGAGTILDFTEDGEYMVELDKGNISMCIPFENADMIGLRKVCSSIQIDALFLKLKNTDFDINTNWSQRYKENMQKIKSGDLFLVAEVVRDLLKIDNDRGLSTGEKKMLNNAKKIFVSEVICAKRIEENEAEKLINSLIDEKSH